MEVGVAPKRSTRSGACASRHGPARHRRSPRATTCERSCGPQRTPDSGSARIGNPLASARRASAAGSAGSSCGPAMMSPRRAPARRSARSATAAAARIRGPARTSVNGRVGAASSGAGVRRSPSGISGSRNGMLRWTAPAGPASAVATARPATERTWRRVSGVPSSNGSSANHFAWTPKSRAWSIAWGAPRSRSSGGRSAVSRTSGTRPSVASTAAGSRFAAAVPDVTRTPAARRDARARPSAKKPAARSSSRTRTRIPGCARRASASGVERDPGQIDDVAAFRRGPARPRTRAARRRRSRPLLRQAAESGGDRSQLHPRLFPLP